MRAGIANAVRGRPDFDLVGEASQGDPALAMIRDLNPDVAVMDVKLPGLSGLDVLRAVTRAGLTTRVLFLSAFTAPATVYDALHAGAAGYVSKDLDSAAICDAIAQVADGKIVLGPHVQQEIAGEIRGRELGETPLSPRELEILQRTAQGETAAQIAAHLFLSPATVKTYLQRTYGKLEVSDRAAAVAEAMRRGLLQ